MPSKKTLRRKLKVARRRYAEGRNTVLKTSGQVLLLQSAMEDATADALRLHGEKMDIFDELLTLKIAVQEVLEAFDTSAHIPIASSHPLHRAMATLRSLQPKTMRLSSH